MVLSFAICVTAVLLELGAVLLLLRRSLWREYPFFFLYAVWLLIGNSAILVVDLWFPTLYATAFWYSDSSDIILRLLVVWEVFRQTFPKNSGLSRSFSKGLGIVAAGLLVLGCLTFLGYQNYGLPSLAYPAQARVASWRPHLALDRSFGFVEALMVLGTLVVARYYGVKCGRNVRGIALAFGAWTSISTANNAMIDLANSFVPLFYYLRPLSFVIMLVVWLWALWVYEPNPPIIESDEVELSQWTQDWNRTITAARTIVRP
jgi:hypothetical protein